ncbi:PD-(D/E)XK nuclease-like domain-containing protein [Streptomyces sp. PKU-EA00015]|uniref:PD-(D/E)XK nuclease-like domain-containing protein n=1 Tax=Streptomyces sp. PKU-EA00015 TaxID=2748326 RepID=UPI002811DFCA|nr:PD-(D/E)XK nuclease-like domain-containing protein [Streptomyces sp. PKU-EA00015]
MTTAAEVEPGLYDISAELYHSDPIPGGSLSSTGARRLTDCPARFKYFLDHPEPYKPEFEFGTAAHTVILGNGPELVVVDEKRWDTDETKARVAAIRAAGNVPLKAEARQRIDDMAEALARHPEASDLLTPGSGLAEQSAFWQDDNGIWHRTRFDWLRPEEIVDYKTARSVHPDALQKAVNEHGYHQQDDFYRKVAIHLGLIPPTGSFKFIFQEKQPPYLVTVAELDFPARVIGAELNDRALYTYAMCQATGHWPAYSEGTTHISLPPWVERKYAQENS